MSIQVAFMGFRMALDGMTSQDMKTACIEIETNILEKRGDDGAQFIMDIGWAYSDGEYPPIAELVETLEDSDLKLLLRDLLWFDYYGKEFDEDEDI